MFVFTFYNVLFLMILHVSNCHRRITDGAVLDEGRKYVAYLIKASISSQYYQGWVCAGALVSEDFIVTSAACVTDVIHLYAIAGYIEYVNGDQIHSNPCTKEKKKKVVLICTPKAYELVYEELETWSYIDIAVVKVESPYDFNDNTYATLCTYTPAPIIINYDQKYQEPGTDALVFGWGHHEQWRQQDDPEDYNQQFLNYASALIQGKEECKKEYLDYEKMGNVIDKYMICTQDAGNIDAKGESIVTPVPEAEGCAQHLRKLKGYEGLSCESADKPREEIMLIENSRKLINNANQTSHDINDKSKNSTSSEISSNAVDSNSHQNSSLINKTLNIANPKRSLNTRRHGICQNDHGGPLVTWVGGHEVLIGVASVFKITEDFKCVGPYLYASTQCNGRFLDCILRNDPNQTPGTRREFCDQPASEKGFDIIETHVSWVDHPHGPAENEKNFTSLDEAFKNIVREKFLTIATSTINSTISNFMSEDMKQKSKLEEQYHNYTENVTNPTISHQTMNTTVSNHTINNSTTVNNIVNTTIFNQFITTILNLPINNTSSSFHTHTTNAPSINTTIQRTTLTVDAHQSF